MENFTPPYNKTREYILIILFALLLAICAITAGNPADASGGSKMSINVAQALDQGKKWRSSEIGKANLFEATYAVYYDFGAWAWKYRAVRMPSKIAIYTKIESAGNCYGAADWMSGELGLLSVKRAVAKKHDINACHPELNIWSAQKLYHDKLNDLYELWPWLAQEDVEQQMLIADMTTTAGIGATIYLVNQATAGGKHPTDPYNRVVKWIKSKGNKLYQKKYASHWGQQKANRAMYRVGLAYAIHQRALEMQNGNLCIDEEPEWEDVQPTNQYQWPGASKHNQWCKKYWPEFYDIMPSKEERALWIEEMQKQSCVPPDFDPS